MRSRPLFAALFLLAGGLELSRRLLLGHLEVFSGGVSEGLFCGAGGRFDCDAVAAHESSWLFGYPLPLFGLLYYAAVLAIAAAAALLRGADRKALLALGTTAAVMAVLFDVWLLLVMLLEVEALCPSCLATYAVNVLLALCFWRLDRGLRLPVRWGRLLPAPRALLGDAGADYYRAVVKAGLAALALVGLASVYVVSVVPFVRVREKGERTITELFVRMNTTAPDVDPGRFAGRPSIGPETADVTVVVFADFQCTFCRSLARTLHALQARWPEDVRLVHVSSPVSSRCNPHVTEDLHPDACWLAEVGAVAHARGGFWEYHDWLSFRLSGADLAREVVRARLGEVGLEAAGVEAALAGGEPGRAVADDVALCAELGITATPSLVLNGYVHAGTMYPWMLEQLLGFLVEPGSAEEPPD